MKAVRMIVVGFVAMILAGPGGCGKSDAGAGVDVSMSKESTPEALSIPERHEGFVFRYRDPESGQVASATAIGAIPAAARRAVVVFDPNNNPPAGADFVADFSGDPPYTARAINGFAFVPPAVVSQATAAPDRKAVEVVVFATDWCGYCSKARKFFSDRKVPFTEIDIEKDPRGEARLGELARKAGINRESLSGVPIIFINGKPVVGWDEGQVKRLLSGG